MQLAEREWADRSGTVRAARCGRLRRAGRREWHQALEGLGIKVQPAAADAAMKELDIDGGSTLEVVELVDKIEEFQRKRRVFVSTVLGRVCEYVDSTNTSLVRLFARVDRDGSGDAGFKARVRKSLLRRGSFGRRAARRNFQEHLPDETGQHRGGRRREEHATW